MNDISELVNILRFLGGKASLITICQEYGKKYKMFIAPQHKTIIESTLKKYPHLVFFDEDLGIWKLKEEESKPYHSHSEVSKPGKTGDVHFLRDTVYNWATEKIKEGSVLEIFGNGGQRQTMVTPYMAELVPRVSSFQKAHYTGYYCLYEIEIRPQKAVVRLMVTVTEKTPDSIIETYKQTILPSIGKAYRPDGRFYNKTFGSMKLSPETTNSDMVVFMENALVQIQAYEKELQRL